MPLSTQVDLTLTNLKNAKELKVLVIYVMLRHEPTIYSIRVKLLAHV